MWTPWRGLGWSLSVSSTLALGSPVMAAEATRVASSFEKTDRFDIHFGIGYSYDFRQAAILREWISGAENTETQVAKDLVYRHQQHTLTPTVEVGIWHNLAIYSELPIVLFDASQYAF